MLVSLTNFFESLATDGGFFVATRGPIVREAKWWFPVVALIVVTYGRYFAGVQVVNSRRKGYYGYPVMAYVAYSVRNISPFHVTRFRVPQRILGYCRRRYLGSQCRTGALGRIGGLEVCFAICILLNQL